MYSRDGYWGNDYGFSSGLVIRNQGLVGVVISNSGHQQWTLGLHSFGIISKNIFWGGEKIKDCHQGYQGMILGTSKLSKNLIKSLSLWIRPSQGKRALFLGQDCVFLEILTKRAQNLQASILNLLSMLFNPSQVPSIVINFSLDSCSAYYGLIMVIVQISDRCHPMYFLGRGIRYEQRVKIGRHCKLRWKEAL